MNERHPPAPRHVPAPIQWAVTAYTERHQQGRVLADKLARLDAHIAETEKVLRELRHGYAETTREYKAVTEDAETLLLMARQACEKLGIDMPPAGGDALAPGTPADGRPEGSAADPAATADGGRRADGHYAARQPGLPTERPAPSGAAPIRCGHCAGEIGWNAEQERWTHRPGGEFACDPQAELSPAANPDPAFREQVAVLHRPGRPAGDTKADGTGTGVARSEGGAPADTGGFQAEQSPGA